MKCIPMTFSERPVADDLRAILGELGLEVELWEDKAGFGPKFLEN